ncbi:MAG: hypothetical protein PW735_01875 [Acidobacteriaceae bacterium]|nr:hypothetical protein [Acidobacteriaceae bacterium]
MKAIASQVRPTVSGNISATPKTMADLAALSSAHPATGKEDFSSLLGDAVKNISAEEPVQVESAPEVQVAQAVPSDQGKKSSPASKDSLIVAAPAVGAELSLAPEAIASSKESKKETTEPKRAKASHEGKDEISKPGKIDEGATGAVSSSVVPAQVEVASTGSVAMTTSVVAPTIVAAMLPDDAQEKIASTDEPKKVGSIKTVSGSLSKTKTAHADVPVSAAEDKEASRSDTTSDVGKSVSFSESVPAVERSAKDSPVEASLSALSAIAAPVSKAEPHTERAASVLGDSALNATSDVASLPTVQSVEVRSSNQLEIAVSSGELGTVRVKASIGEHDEIRAWVSGSETAVAEIKQHRSELSTYLAEQRTPVQHLVIEASSSSGMSSGGQGSSSSSLSQWTQGDSQKRESDGKEEKRQEATTLQRRTSLEGEEGSLRASLFPDSSSGTALATSGSWLSVRV